MAEKWQTQDSARTMTRKYNETVEQVNNFMKSSENHGQNTDKSLEDIYKQLDKKVNTETAKTDLQLDRVDNTTDMDKPLSNPQARAIEVATEYMLTSEPISGVDVGAPPIGVLAEICVSGTKLVMNTDNAEVAQKISIYIAKNRLVFITL